MIDSSERHLTTLLKNFLDSTMQPSTGNEKIIFVYELRTLQGRPDLVLFRKNFSQHESDAVQNAGKAMASHTSAAILGLLHQENKIPLGSLSEKIHISERSIRYSLVNLTDASLIEIRGNFIVQTSFLQRLSVPLTAIEVKRSLSERAVFQARQYLSFAARGIITIWNDHLAKKLSNSVKHLDPFGLIGIRPDGEAHFIHSCRELSPRNPMAYYYALGNAYAGNSVRPSGFAARLSQ